jgi:hypothetical protein
MPPLVSMRNRGPSSWVVAVCAGGCWGCSVYDSSLLQFSEGANEGVGGDATSVAGNVQPGSGGTTGSSTHGTDGDIDTETEAGDPADLSDAAIDVPPLPASCMDTAKNGTETDVDCGGMDCAPCSTGQACLGWHDCGGGICNAGQCEIAKTCSEIHTKSAAAESGVYQVDVDAAGALLPFPVFCDMKTANGGWTRVGFEPSGSGGNTIAGRLSYLGIEVGTPISLSRASGAALVGVRFDGLYKELWINWGSTFARMTVPRDIFTNTVDTAIPVTNFVTSDAKIVGWVNASGGALFCRAAKSMDQRPGDSSWAIKPLNNVDISCGCSGSGWTNRGGFYGGTVPATECSSWGGAWAGARDNGEQKGGIASNVDLTLWVR